MPPSAIDQLRVAFPVRHVAVCPDGWAVVFPTTNNKMITQLKRAFPEAEFVERRITDSPAFTFWLIPPEDGTETRLSAFAETFGFELTPKAREEMSRALADKEASHKLAGQTRPSKKIAVPDLVVPLRDYQLAALEYGMERDRLYIADSPGVGKTAPGIAWIHIKQAYPCLTVTPASARTQWAQEYKHFFGDSIKARIFSGPMKEEDMRFFAQGNGPRAAIVSWNGLTAWGAAIRSIAWGGVILDEAQLARKLAARRTRDALLISKDIPRRIALSGTPAERGGKDLSSQLAILGVRDQFAGYRALEVERPTHADSLAVNLRLSEILMVRRRKEDVLDQLPELDETWNALDLDARLLVAYQRKEREIYERLQENSDPKVPMGTLRRLVGEAKVDAVLDFMEPYWSTDAAPLLFCYHHSVMSALSEKLEAKGLHTIRFDGTMTPTQKDNAIRRFQEGHGRVLIAQMTAAGVALNLQRADTVFFAENEWLSTVYEQCVARSWRSNNKAAKVAVRKLYCPGSIDEDMKAIVTDRARTIGVLIDSDRSSRAVLNAFRSRIKAREADGS